jgi:TetR/AcrR family transcriptional regulator, transcriptional repressor of bet genes
VSSRSKKTEVPVERARSAHNRQRQRLIDACISALHIHGPSRTTVEKVVAIAKMSPGIVRFYFDSKAALLVASLQFLAAEFEEQLLVPVSKLKSNPVAALELLVDLYLDPEIASPRKVSVWYSFWGEASSRQEYYDICGQKDESFAALVRELIGRLIELSAQRELDADGVALGLIGVLEMLWQDFAFRSEDDIDRRAARRRAMAYLKSIFPGQFVPAAEPRRAGVQRFAGWVYGHERAFALERPVLFHAWQAAAHESELPRAGDFVTADLGVERVLLIRDSYGAIQALRNSCPEVPHALVTARRGRIEDRIECPVHGRTFDRNGRSAGGGRAGLEPLDLHTAGGFLLVRSAAGAVHAAPLWPEGAASAPLRALAAPPDIEVQADWKLLAELWLASADAEGAPSTAAGLLSWSSHPAAAPSWSAARYRRLAGSAAVELWHQRFVAPNQLLQSRPDGATLLQAIAVAPGRCRVRRIHLTHLTSEPEAAAAQFLSARLMRLERRSALAVAESAQRGVIDFGYRPAAESSVRAGVAWFRERLSGQLPALSLERPPTDL